MDIFTKDGKEILRIDDNGKEIADWDLFKKLKDKEKKEEKNETTESKVLSEDR